MSYNQGRSTAMSGQVLVLVLGLAVAGALLGTQVFLAVRFRRLVNPALAAATVLAVGLAIAGAVQLGAQAGNLKVAKQDAFDSILALTQARAVSYDANADETRFLVDPGRAAAYQDAFLRKSQELVNVGNVGHATGSPWIALIPAIGAALIAALAIGGTHRRNAPAAGRIPVRK